MNKISDYKYPDGIFDLPVPVISMDMVIFTIYKEKLCVVLDAVEDNDGRVKYLLPGGIIEKGIALGENFDRILKKQTGIQGAYKEQLRVFGDPTRDPRGHVLSITYFALINKDDFLHDADFTKIQILEYNKLDSIEIGLFFDHKRIIRAAKERLDIKLDYTDIVKNIVPKSFTIPHLHQVYETILGHTIDARNFRKKLFFLGIVRETGAFDKKHSNRPARLYEFVDMRGERHVGLI